MGPKSGGGWGAYAAPLETCLKPIFLVILEDLKQIEIVLEISAPVVNFSFQTPTIKSRGLLSK